MNQALRIRGGAPLRGRAQLPADLGVTECALMFAALGEGESRLRACPRSEQIDVALGAWSALGVDCKREGDDVVVRGVGLHGLSAPRGALECGRSPQLLAQLAGVVSAQAFGTRLLVHPTLAGLPIEHMIGLLRARGAQIAASGKPDERLTPPIAIAPLVPPEHLAGLDATLPLADRDAKLAALVSGLYASAPTTLSEPNLSSDHTERMFVALGLALRRIGSVVSFEPQTRALPALGTIDLPGSAALAGHFACLSQLLPGSDLQLRDVSVNPSESGTLDLLRSWSGGALAITPTGDAALREPIADLHLRTAAVRGGVVGIELLARASETLPALAALGIATQRGVRLCDLPWLAGRSDTSLFALDPVFAAFGVTIERGQGELFIGPRAERLRNTRPVNAQDNPELALLACTLALATPGETVVEHAAAALAAVHPGFVPTARLFGASIELA